MNKYREELAKNLSEQECPYCNCKDIGIDNWGMFPGINDWFYFCKDCDATFNGTIQKDEEFNEDIKKKLKTIFENGVGSIKKY